MFRRDRRSLAGSKRPSGWLLSFLPSFSNPVLLRGLRFGKEKPCFKSPRRRGTWEPATCLIREIKDV